MGKDLSLKVYPDTYVVLDIETTGLSPLKSEIIELSAIKYENGYFSENFSMLVKPEGKVNPFITRLTGITDEMLEDADDIGFVLEEFAKFVNGYIVMGHNVKFDIGFLDYNFRKYMNKPFYNDYIDTLRLARRFLPQLTSHKLGVLSEFYGFDSEGMHRALKDCQVTNSCYEKFLDMQKSQMLELI